MRRQLLMMVSAFIVSCSVEQSSDDDIETVAGISWHAEVRPIIETNCVSCHAEGRIGGFALDSYDDVYAWRASVADAVESGRMPPWKPDADCRPLQNDLSMASDEIDTLVAWVEAGAPEGDPETSSAGDPWEPIELLRVDQTLSMPVAYSPEDGSDDDYRCFALDWPYEEDVYVTGYTVNPGNASMVHHVIAYLIDSDDLGELDALDPNGEGYSCFGGPGVGSQESAHWLGGWAPGSFQGGLPEGTGILVESGSKVVLQIHYNLEADDGGTDLTTLDVMVEDKVDRPAQIQPWADPSWLDGANMVIPANSTDVSHSFSYTIPLNVRIYTGNLHMHEIGRSARLS
ncbi:MAG TPA: hypothetical protein EYM97_07250, partial [Gemmatimonadetes bacterium]|nr:hypothetical protein [Gemmatimonadota bacterium]